MVRFFGFYHTSTVCCDYIYNIKQSTRDEENVIIDISGIIDESNPFQLRDYKTHKENTNSFTGHSFVVKLEHNVYASWCSCNQLEFNKSQTLLLDGGQFVTMICFLCQHHKSCLYLKRSVKALHHNYQDSRHFDLNLTCWNKPTRIYYNATRGLRKNESCCGALNFQQFSSDYKLCKNCRLATAVHMKSLKRNTDLASRHGSIHSIIYIHEMCKLLKFTLERAHTAQYILSADGLQNILHFINVAVQCITSYFYFVCYKNDRFSLSIFHCLLDVLSEFICIFCQHCCKFHTLVNKPEVLLSAIVVFVTMLLKKQASEQLDLMTNFLNIYDVANIIAPLKILAMIFAAQWKPKTWCSASTKRLYKYAVAGLAGSGISGQRKGWIKQLKPKYSQYLKIENEQLLFKAVECQWKRCDKTKNMVLKTQWKKCEKCKLARYCSRKCQKLDWNKGFHRFICHRL